MLHLLAKELLLSTQNPLQHKTAAYRVGVICNAVKCCCSNIGRSGEQKWASSPLPRIYLDVVGDWHGDAVLTGDVVGAVIRGAWARARGAATCRVWAAQIKESSKWLRLRWKGNSVNEEGLRITNLPYQGSVSWRWWWGCLGDAAADCSSARSPSASAWSEASGWVPRLDRSQKNTKKRHCPYQV